MTGDELPEMPLNGAAVGNGDASMDMHSVIAKKVLVGGKGGVGKTTFLKNAGFALNAEVDNLGDTKMTIGVGTYTAKINDRKIAIWDLGGQERWRFIIGDYMKGAECAILMYDLTQDATVTDLKNYWFPEAKKHNVPKIALIGNKADLLETEPESSSAYEIARSLDTPLHYAISAKFDPQKKLKSILEECCTM